jgi:large subunit ribosomal protein L16
MLLFPRKTKFKKHQKGFYRFKGLEHGLILPKNGFYGLKLLTTSRIKNTQIEAARKAIRKRIKKKYREQVKINVFTDCVATRKSSGIRMGKGKGNLDYWYSCVKGGKIIFELKKKIPKSVAKKAFMAASFKFSVKSKFIEKYNILD